LAFHGLLQMVLLGMLLSLYALWRHLESRRGGWLVAAVLAWACSALTYEVAYCLLPAHALFILRRQGPGKRAAWTFLPFALFFLVGLAAPSVLRWASGNHVANAYKPNLAPSAVLATLGKEAFAALPLSYRFAAHEGCPYPGFRTALRSTLPVFAASLAL